jgi:hypothetical protein
VRWHLWQRAVGNRVLLVQRPIDILGKVLAVYLNGVLGAAQVNLTLRQSDPVLKDVKCRCLLRREKASIIGQVLLVFLHAGLLNKNGILIHKKGGIGLFCLVDHAS